MTYKQKLLNLQTDTIMEVVEYTIHRHVGDHLTPMGKRALIDKVRKDIRLGLSEIHPELQ